MSIASTSPRRQPAKPMYQVTYTLQSKEKRSKALVTKTAGSFEDKFASKTISIKVVDTTSSFSATSRNRDELEELPGDFGLGKFVRSEVESIGDDDEPTWQEHAKHWRM